MRASHAAAKQANAVASLEERVSSIEKDTKRILKLLKGAPVVEITNASGEIFEVDGVGEPFEGEPGWGISDGEVYGLFASVEQLCQMAGATWEAPNIEAEGFDPTVFIQAHLAKIAERVAASPPPAPQMPAPPPSPDAAQPKLPEAGKVGSDPDKPGGKGK